MRWLEVRRHARTKKGAARGSGSHLSQAGVDQARWAGRDIGPVQWVVASIVPRTVETALAMGYAVDELADMDGGWWERAQAEVPRHAQWDWPDPFGRYLELIGQGGPTAGLARHQRDIWTQAISQVGDGGRVLVVSHDGTDFVSAVLHRQPAGSG